LVADAAYLVEDEPDEIPPRNQFAILDGIVLASWAIR
jgi:hypothetical protein